MGEIGAGSRVRTRDPLITNQVLYQLSYTGLAPPLAFPIPFSNSGRAPGVNSWEGGSFVMMGARGWFVGGELFFCDGGAGPHFLLWARGFGESALAGREHDRQKCPRAFWHKGFRPFWA